MEYINDTTDKEIAEYKEELGKKKIYYQNLRDSMDSEVDKKILDGHIQEYKDILLKLNEESYRRYSKHVSY